MGKKLVHWSFLHKVKLGTKLLELLNTLDLIGSNIVFRLTWYLDYLHKCSNAT
jgi:hypothetical protein